MTVYKVRCYEAGIWDGNEPHEVEANDPREAVEAVCGGPLSDAGKPGQLRAEAWPVSAPANVRPWY